MTPPLCEALAPAGARLAATAPVRRSYEIGRDVGHPRTAGRRSSDLDLGRRGARLAEDVLAARSAAGADIDGHAYGGISLRTRRSRVRFRSARRVGGRFSDPALGGPR